MAVPAVPAKRSRAKAPPPEVDHAATLAASQARRLAVAEEAEAARLEVLEAVAEASRQGWGHRRIADALGVTKARAQQLVNDAKKLGLLD